LKLRHFEALQPICPVCRTERNRDDSRLTIGSVTKSDDTSITEGILLCQSQDCQREFPIIDGIPLIIPHIRSWIESNISQLYARDDLGGITESLLTDCCGAGSEFESARQHVSSYTWDHYAEFDSNEPEGTHQPGQIVRLLDQCLAVANPIQEGPILDAGCGVGRTSFALAERTSELVLGIDLHYAMLRVASRVLSSETVRYPRRRVGIVYDVHDFPVQFPNSEIVDFWGCDAHSLPFRDGTFGTTVSMNMLDCVHSPMHFLQSVARVTSPGRQVMLACPYDWAPAATPIEGWLGGHSQRSKTEGESNLLLRSMLTPGDPNHVFPNMRLAGEADNLKWHVRLHDRSTMTYAVHLVVADITDE
jgi:SAM-dependent methyltransferase/uncharacterized protein YbaR (Trm112 family)